MWSVELVWRTAKRSRSEDVRVGKRAIAERVRIRKSKDPASSSSSSSLGMFQSEWRGGGHFIRRFGWIGMAAACHSCFGGWRSIQSYLAYFASATHSVALLSANTPVGLVIWLSPAPDAHVVVLGCPRTWAIVAVAPIVLQASNRSTRLLNASLTQHLFSWFVCFRSCLGCELNRDGSNQRGAVCWWRTCRLDGTQSRRERPSVSHRRQSLP